MRYKHIFGMRDILHRLGVVLRSTRSHYDVEREGEETQVSRSMIQCKIFPNRANDSRKDETQERDVHISIDAR